MAGIGLYLRPVGFLYGAVAETAIADGLALPLAGGPIAFTCSRADRGAPGSASRALVAATNLLRPKIQTLPPCSHASPRHDCPSPG